VSNSAFCFCGSAIPFQDCCGKYITGIEKAPTALALMKSRYSAFAIQQADYLLSTTHISQRKYYFKADVLNENKQNQIHHEFSTFKQENGSWFYVDGKFK
jgi:SEC-C motif domain protein